jgi:hypothetical protein
LDDFAIADLLHCLQTYADSDFDAAWVSLTTQEAEALAIILIQTLIANLNGKLLASHLDALRHQELHITQSLPALKLSLPSTDLPVSFPKVEIPRFLYGDRLRWISNNETSDWGTVIGCFYNFAPHRCQWYWCYLIWLDQSSPSAAWISADIAWEEDLQVFDPVTSECLIKNQSL